VRDTYPKTLAGSRDEIRGHFSGGSEVFVVDRDVIQLVVAIFWAL
jgi:hypothetical protein